MTRRRRRGSGTRSKSDARLTTAYSPPSSVAAACTARAAARFEALPHLVLHEVVEIADRRHAGALVDRRLDLRRHRHVLDDEARDFDAVLARDRRVDERQERLGEDLEGEGARADRRRDALPLRVEEVPAERVVALRKAIMDMVRDPAFLAEAEKQTLDIDAVSGEEAQRIVEAAYASPASVVERVRRIYETQMR